jgi:hypothetical protein
VKGATGPVTFAVIIFLCILVVLPKKGRNAMTFALTKKLQTRRQALYLAIGLAAVPLVLAAQPVLADDDDDRKRREEEDRKRHEDEDRKRTEEEERKRKEEEDHDRHDNDKKDRE